MIPTNLSSTLRALIVTGKGTASKFASDRGLSQSTISRLIAEDRRIDPETLRTLATHEDKEGLEILISHLRDEIDRSGRLQSEVQIEAADVRLDDLALLSTEAQTNPDLRAMIHDMANLVRRYQLAQPEHHLHAAEDAPTPGEGLSLADQIIAAEQDARSKKSSSPATYPKRGKK